MAGAGVWAEVEVAAGDAEDPRPRATGDTVGSEAGTGLLLRTRTTAETGTGTRAETRAGADRPRHPTIATAAAARTIITATRCRAPTPRHPEAILLPGTPHRAGDTSRAM